MNREEYFEIADGYADDIKAKVDRGKLSEQKANRLIGKLNEWVEENDWRR